MGHDETRGKPPSDSPGPLEEGTNPASELTDLHSAFDFIDDTMKEVVARRDGTVTPETIEQIVNDAVAKALAAHQQARGVTPEAPAASQGSNQAGGFASRQPADPAAAHLSTWHAKLERLQGDMGLDEIEFERAPDEPTETVAQGTLSTQMGVHDFEFDEVSEAAAEPDMVPLDIEGMADWIATTAPSPDVGQVRSSASKPRTGEADQELDWVATQLAEFDAAQIKLAGEPPAAPRDPVPPLYQAPKPVTTAYQAPTPVAPAHQAPEAVAPAIEKAVAPVIEKTVAPVIEKTVAPVIEKTAAPAIEKPIAASKPEVRETRSGLASWFRSALGTKSPQREPAAVPVPKAAAPPMPAAAAPEPVVPPVVPVKPEPVIPVKPEPVVRATPAPVVTAPPPIATRPEPPAPKPAPERAAAAKPIPPEEAAKSVFFTFDPIPPVPPRLPRDPKEPRKG